MNWKFEREEQEFEKIPVGEHRVRIAQVEKKQSKSGNDMIEIILDVSGYSSRIWHYITFLPDYPQITNRNLTQLFDSFGIADGDFNTANWIGKVGACKTKEDEYGAKVHYFIAKDKQDNLPPWKDAGTGGTAGKPAMKVFDDSDSDIPF